MTRSIHMFWMIGLAAVFMAGPVLGQSSSLYTTSEEQVRSVAAARYDTVNDRTRRQLPDIHPDVSRYTSYFKNRPAPREFMVNDPITIIVRESFESEIEADKNTKKRSSLSGGINAIPPLSLKDLLNLQINGTSTPTNPALVDIGFDRINKGQGDYARIESMTGRVRARIIDIKPNGMLVLEARRTVINDDEQSLLVATGNCMPEDVNADNTIVSTQLENLFIKKNHSGDLRESGRKGWLTQLFDTVFDF